MSHINNEFNVHQDDEYVDEYEFGNSSDYEYEFTERYNMYENDTRAHFLEHESENQYTETWLMSIEDKINKNHIYYTHNTELNNKIILDERKNKIILSLEENMYTNIFSINCEEIHIKPNCCDICGDKCVSLRYCRGRLYDDSYSNHYEICYLFPNYVESLLFFKILCQSINPKKIKAKIYDFRINKLLVLELYKIFNKIDSYNLINVISYL
jgi:hypothetical protein